jgi:hypothetical protein
MSFLNKKPKDKPKSKLAGVLPHEEDKPLMLRICDQCYESLNQSIIHANQHDLVAVHCPHYLVLLEVALNEGKPIGVIMSGPLSEDEAKLKIDSEFYFNSLDKNSSMQ